MEEVGREIGNEESRFYVKTNYATLLIGAALREIDYLFKICYMTIYLSFCMFSGIC